MESIQTATGHGSLLASLCGGRPRDRNLNSQLGRVSGVRLLNFKSHAGVLMNKLLKAEVQHYWSIVSIAGAT
jgi:hypothetical protein